MQSIENEKYWRLLINQSLLRFFLLKSLEKEPIHGYGLQSVMTSISNGLCRPSQGTIYPALNELEANGYVCGKWEKIKNRKRKIYSLTGKGNKALKIASEVLNKALQSTSASEKENNLKKPLPIPAIKEIESDEEKQTLPFKI